MGGKVVQIRLQQKEVNGLVSCRATFRFKPSAFKVSERKKMTAACHNSSNILNFMLEKLDACLSIRELSEDVNQHDFDVTAAKSNE